MRTAIHAELIRIVRTRRAALLGTLALVSIAASFAVNCFQSLQMLADIEVARYSGPMTDEWRQVLEAYGPVGQTSELLTSGQGLGIYLVLLLGVLTVTDEFRFGLASTTFLAQPSRVRVLAGKAAAVALCGAGLWLVTTVLNLIAALVFFNANDYTASFAPSVLRSVLLNLCAYLLWAILGTGLGVLLRGQVLAAVVGTLLFMIDSPTAVSAITSVQWLFTGGEPRFSAMAVAVVFPRVATEVMASTLSKFQGDPQYWWAGAAILLTYGLTAAALGVWRLTKRDVER